MPLEHYRKEIDQIDNELTALFLRRMDVVQQVAEYKLKHDMEVLQPQREKALLDKITCGLSAHEADCVTELYQTILLISRKSQQKLIKQHKEATE